MNEEEARQRVASQVGVTRQHVVIAKSYIVKNSLGDSKTMLHRLLRDYDAPMLPELVLHPTVPLAPQVGQVAKWITWQLAFGEAVWGLLNTGVLIPLDLTLFEAHPQQQWTTVVPGSGGHTGSWDFDEHRISVPRLLRLAPSTTSQAPQPLSDADLYLADIGIPDLDVEVEESLRDAVQCFRYDLYVPCLAMLTRAFEGAWIELGHSLLGFEPDNPRLPADRRLKTRETLNGSRRGIMAKVDTVLRLYDRDVYSRLRDECGCPPRYLRRVAAWTDVVRDSRNAVHYGVEPATQNTYEKVAALLLGAAPNLRVICAILRAAEQVTKSQAGLERGSQ
jgi:hypothetical protein